MRVLQLTKFYPPVMGGIESVVYELTEGLNARGVRTDVLCAHTHNATISESYEGRYAVTRVASLGKFLSTSMAPAMFGALRSLAPSYDVIHVHLPDPLTNLALWLARPKARIVVSWHSDIVAQKKALRIYAPLQQWLLRRCDVVVATSPPYAASSPWLAPFLQKTAVIPIGIRDASVGQHQVEAVSRIKSRHGSSRLVFALGRMTYYKGFDVLIEAAKLLPPDVAVIVGGSGELLATFRERVVAAGLSGRFEMPGRISDADLPAYFAAADIFCLPSTARSEAFGVVMLEAMRAGKPIVATDIQGSGVPWVNLNGVTGVNVAPSNAPALADALATLCGDPTQRAAYGRNARQRFEQLFSADAMVEAYAALYAQHR